MKKRIMLLKKHPNKWLFVWLLTLIGISNGNAQNVSNYAVTTNTTSSLAVDLNSNLIDMSAGTTSLITTGADNTASSVTGIGFTFTFDGVAYTQFSASTNGLIRLGATVVGAATYGIGQTSQALIAPFAGDLEIKNSGKIHFKLIGTAPNRTLVVEFLDMGLDYTGTYTDAGDGSFQARLYESSNIIEFVYANMFRNTTITNSATLTFNVGISSSNTAATIASVNTNTNNVTNALFANAYTLGAIITDLHSTTNGSRKAYIFTPPPPCIGAPVSQPTALSFSGITSSRINLSFTNAVPTPSMYLIVRYPTGATVTNPVNGTIYAPNQALGLGTVLAFTNVPATSTTGLVAGTTYDFYVYSTSLCAPGGPEYNVTSPLTGTQATLPPARIVSTATGGLWSAASTWVGGSVPIPFDTTQIASGATVIVDVPVTTAQLELSNNATLSLNNTLVDSGNLVLGVGAVLNTFLGTVGRQLTIRKDIINAGTLNMAIPGSILLLNGSTPQTVSGSGTFSLIPTLTVNNLNGIALNSNLIVSNALNLTNGIVSGFGTLTLGNASFNNAFAMTSTGGRLTCPAVSGLAGILPGNATFIYNAPTPVASITTGNELNIAAGTNMNVTFNAIAGGNYILGSNININNLNLNDTLDVDVNTLTVNGTATFIAIPFVTGAGTFTMGANATLATTNQLGITASSSTGSVQTATRNYSATGNYTFNGASGQVTGDGLPTTLTGGTVTISTTAGTLLSQSTVFNNLTLTTNLLLGTNAATINGTGNLGTLAITGAGSFTAGATSRLLLNSTATAGVLQTTGTNGNIQNTGGRTYSLGMDIVLGGAAVATGNDFPTAGIDSLVLNQTSTIVLTAATSANTLFITNTGRLTTTSTNTLTILGNQSGNVARTSTGYIDGPLTRTIGLGAVGSFVFPLGVGATANLGLEIINPVVSIADITLTAIARSLATGGNVGTGLTSLTNTRYWSIAPVGGGGVLTSVGNVRIFESTQATLGGTSKKIGFTTQLSNGTYNSIGGQLDSANVNILSSLPIPAFGVGADSTFFVLGNGTATGTFAGGTYTVGPTGNYFSLTAAIAAINESTSLTGPVVLEFQGTYNPSVETYPIVFRATLPTTSNRTITIRPSIGVTNNIAFNGYIFTSTALIDFNGAKNIIIDGRPGGTGTNRFISFNQQTIGTFPTIRFINDAQNDTLRFISVLGRNTSTSSGLIFISNTNGTGGNNNLAISNCTINGLSNTVNCILGTGSTAPADNKNITISNNNIFDFFVNGSSPTGLIAGTGCSNWTIDGNNFYQTSIRNSLSVPAMTTATNFRAIQLNNTATNANFTVTNNRVGGNIPGIAGSVFVLGDSISNLGHLFRPFDFSNVGTLIPTSVQGNTISDITLYTNGTDNFTGIGALQAGAYNIGNLIGNTVGSATGNNSINLIFRGTTNSNARGIQFTGTSGGLVQNNTVGGITLTVQGAQSANISFFFAAINAGATFSQPLTISNNTVGSTTTAHSIQGTASSVGPIAIFGIQPVGATGAAITVSNNTIANLTSFSNAISGDNAARGIWVSGTSSISTTVTNNTIRNLRSDAGNSFNNQFASVIGISSITSGAGSQIISNNTVHSLSSTFNGAVTNNALGIFYNSTNTGGLSRIERNVIHSLETGNANNLATQAGINLGSASTTIQVVNNFVRLGVNVNGATNNANSNFIGIWKQNTTNTAILHNTVYIAGNPSATDTLSFSAAFHKTGSATIDSVMNNIFMNARSNASGTGEHYAARLNNTTGLRSDANLYFANGTGGTLFRNGFDRITNLQSWRSIQKPWEIGSAVGNPLFNAGITNGAATINFTLNANSPVATAAITLSNVTVDQGGNARPAARAIGSFDVGLSALTATNDLYVPRFTYTPSGNRAAANTTFANINITDIGTGISTSGANAPRLWYRNATTSSVWTSVAPTSFTGTGSNATFSYTLNYGPIGTPSAGDKIYYYFVAQDLATTPNIWYSQYAAISPIHSNVNTQTTPPTSVDSFVIAAPFPTSINIPVDYPNLTGTAGLFNAINNGSLSGNTTVTITADVNETGVNQLNNAGMSGFSLTIQPDASLRTLWGNSTTSLIRLNGVSNVVIDGGASKNLRIIDSIGATTSATVGATIEFLGGCTNDSLVNCIIEGNGSSTSRGTVTLGAGNNSNIVIANNEIRAANNDTLRRPANGIFSNNSNNSNVTIGGVAARPGGNNIYDFTFTAINVSNAGNGFTIGSSNNDIDGNRIYQRAISSTQLRGITVSAGNNHIISRNSIGGSAPDRSGSALLTTTTITTCFTGILMNASLATGYQVSNNIVSNIFANSAGSDHSFVGIDIPSGSVSGTISSNTIGGGVNTYDTIRCNGDSKGIRQAGAGTVTISNNIVSNITNQSIQNDFLTGIEGSAGNTTISNNLVRDIVQISTTNTSTAFACVGIQSTSTGSNSVTNNIVNRIVNLSNTASAPAVGISHSSGTNTIIARNRVMNVSARGTNNPLTVGIANTSGTPLISNNQIIIGDSSSATAIVQGVRVEGTATTAIFNNSIFVNARGNSVNHSYGLLRTSTATIDFRNNIVYNKRTNLGTGRNYAIGSTLATGVSGANINYNLLVVNDTNIIAELPAGTAQGWNALNSLYTTTYNTNWAERTSVVAADALFTDTLVGNLGIVTSNPEAWYAHGKGIRIIGQTGDFNNASGVRSGAINTGAVDIGSVEFTPTSIPPIAFADKVPAVNDSTQFFFGSRLIAKAVWGATGSLPSAVNARYYSGVNPSNTGAGTTFMNAYWDMQTSSGGGFDYTLTLMQDSAVLGTVTTPGNLGIAKYLGTGTLWKTVNPTVANNVTGFMFGNDTSFASSNIYTGTNTLVNPLPVKLISFAAEVSNKEDVLVSWSTASETNNMGFDIERSLDGKTFEFVRFVKGAGNSNQRLSYTLLDESAFVKTNTAILYYRLKQLDLNGAYSYSSIVKVSKSAEKSNSIVVYPNPFSTEYQVSFNATSEGAATIETVDLQGKVVAHKTVTVQTGANSIPVTEASNLNAGIYFVRLVVNGETQILKLVKN